MVFEPPGNRCVVLSLIVPTVGGSPVYCYKKDADELVSATEDVE